MANTTYGIDPATLKMTFDDEFNSFSRQMGQNPGHAHAQEQTPLLIVHAKPLMQNAYFQ